MPVVLFQSLVLSHSHVQLIKDIIIVASQVGTIEMWSIVDRKAKVARKVHMSLFVCCHRLFVCCCYYYCYCYHYHYYYWCIVVFAIVVFMSIVFFFFFFFFQNGGKNKKGIGWGQTYIK
jgi:hypothetical protein